MKRTNIINKPIKISDLTFEELYQKVSKDWEIKAQRLQARRWRILRHEIKGLSH